MVVSLESLDPLILPLMEDEAKRKAKQRMNSENGTPFFNFTGKGNSMSDFDASCPHCEEKFKLKGIGLEAKEFIQCPHCRGVIKLDPTDPEKKAIRGARDFAD